MNQLKIIHILPELEEGGVERLIPVFATEQSKMGHDVTVISFGGRLVSLLPKEVRHIKMPVHRKNFFVGMSCARRIAALIRNEKIDIIHAHSRVPAWISYFARKFAPSVKFIYTAHARFSSLNYGLWPIGQADGVTCVSNAVRNHLSEWLPKKNPVRIIYNAPPGRVIPWGGGGTATKRLLFAGRISEKKDPFTLVKALSGLKDEDWELDVLGDGPAMPDLKRLVAELELDGKVHLHGFSNEVPEAMASSDLFLFPSLDEEGLPLILIEALSAGTPVIAADISSVRELTVANENDARELLPVGDVAAWADAIGRYLSGEYAPSLSLKVHLPTRAEMAAQVTDFYREILSVQNT